MLAKLGHYFIHAFLPIDETEVDLDYHSARSYAEKDADRSVKTVAFKVFKNPVQNGEGFGLLVPSIEKMTVSEREKKVTISGFFGAAEDSGDRPQDVRIGGVPAKILSWSQAEVVAQLADDMAGPPSSMPVIG